MNSYEWEAGLLAKYPRPDTGAIRSYYFSLDGGGRDLVTEEIIRKNVSLMVEIGSFLCGSTLQWLACKDDLKVIGVDPWAGDFAAALDKYKVNPVFNPCFSKIDDRDDFIASVRLHGPYLSAVANVAEHADRFYPVRALSPAVLSELAAMNVVPQMIYFDSNKILDDLRVARRLFPEAILCGDDWSWGAEQGYPVQVAVKAYCEEFGDAYRAKRATWVIDRQAAV